MLIKAAQPIGMVLWCQQDAVSLNDRTAVKSFLQPGQQQHQWSTSAGCKLDYIAHSHFEVDVPALRGTFCLLDTHLL